MRLTRRMTPQISFLLISSLLCVTYLTKDVVRFQVFVFIMLIMSYSFAPIHRLKEPFKQLHGIMVLFAVMYFMRAFLDLEILGRPQELFGSNNTVYVFILFGILLQLLFVPSLVLDKCSFSRPFFVFSLLVLGSLVYSLYSILSGNLVLTVDGRIQANERLGVIQYGQLGLTSAIMGIVLFHKRKESILYYVISPLLFAVGLVTIVIAGTRSALAGLIIIGIFFLIARLKVKSIVIAATLVSFLLLISSSVLSFSESLGADSAARLFRLFSEGGDQSSGRFGIWAHALNQLLESPIFGVSCFIDSSVYGVAFLHNAFVEVSYAMGVLGLILFGVINLYALLTTYRVFKSTNVDYLCFAMLYLQYFVYTMFSESIIRLPEYWFFLSMIICVGFQDIPKKERVIVK